MNNNMSYYYIYNFNQTMFFLECGLKIVEIGKGNSGNVYHKFIRDRDSEEVFDKWKKRKSVEQAV